MYFSYTFMFRTFQDWPLFGTTGNHPFYTNDKNSDETFM